MGYRKQFWEHEPTGDEKLIERLEQENTQLKAELGAYRNGGLTEDILRRHDGCIRLAKGCTIVRDEEYTKLKAELAQASKALAYIGSGDATSLTEAEAVARHTLTKLKEGA